MLTMFREGGNDSPFSMRRFLAFYFALVAPFLGIKALEFAASGWVVFLPFGLSVAASLLFMFFTTWGDIGAAVSAAKKSEP